MTINPLCLGLTKEEFPDYVSKLNLDTWKPIGVCLHNTYFPNLKMVDDYLRLKQWTFPQLIENWWVRYRQLGWSAGPHLFVNRDKIWVATPLTMKGVHSPSFNSQYWGIEIVGDYEKEQLPDEIRENVLVAVRVLLAKLSKSANETSLKFHKEDSKTTHKTCPGKNLGDKASWITDLNQHLMRINSWIARALPVIKHWEAFRETRYWDIDHWAIGYGSDATGLAEDLMITETRATAMLEEHLEADLAKVRSLVKVYITERQGAALLSFVYNLGVSALARSTLLTKINAKDFAGAAEEFPKWCKAKVDGVLVVKEGLVKRRLMEQKLFKGEL